MTIRALLDASAVMAFLLQERGAERVKALLRAQGAGISAVNASEIVSHMILRGMAPEVAGTLCPCLGLGVLPLDPATATHAGCLIARTRPFGLSLADRLCLSTAVRLGVPVHTADRAWRPFGDLGVELIR